MPFFSVIIPLYNKADFILNTLNSVQKQTFKDFEVIIVNDGSTDNSFEVAKNLNDERFRVVSQENQGASSARNRGVNLASANWIALLDADDIWYENHLEQLYETIQKLKNVDLVSNAYHVKLSPNYIKTPKYSKTPSEEISLIKNYFEYSYIDPLFWTSSIAFKKTCFDNINGFDENLKTGQDLDLMIRFTLENYVLGYNPKVTLLYQRFTQENLSSTIDLTEKQKYINKHIYNEIKSTSLKKYLDINRYSLCLQAKMNGQMKLYKAMKTQIDISNLSFKQQLILKLPSYILGFLKLIQAKLIAINIYKSAFN
ncbi:glycosyltransferase family 2 protein [Mesohalobacter halotolerans]|uniref:Glycosyltransferase family 2 protein n=1 Tax=Mesohalobacter halotolerans TaxID=1883405 RepID=A0A4V6ALB8_9FLAO|nr:glycosyltransferase family A protein [Mesohalobacter halotolerans]MBS3739186.1 glycosyltransferase family 2 protein [Psychroflexus sp.]TKS56015.1 glycosyltransferase family 2 protein [Mesohalobacter halotolerans]